MGTAWSAFIGSRQKPKLGRGLQNRGRKRRTVLSGTKPGTGPYSQRRPACDPTLVAARIVSVAHDFVGVEDLGNHMTSARSWYLGRSERIALSTRLAGERLNGTAIVTVLLSAGRHFIIRETS